MKSDDKNNSARIVTIDYSIPNNNIPMVYLGSPERWGRNNLGSHFELETLLDGRDRIHLDRFGDKSRYIFSMAEVASQVEENHAT